jgi:hypothetical protein
MKIEHRKISRGEIIFLMVILIASAVIFIATNLPHNRGNAAWINYDGVAVPVMLDTVREFTLSEIYGDAPQMTFEIRFGEIAVISSDCPGNDCVHTGSIPLNGRVIVCVPNRVTVTVIDENIVYDHVI